MSHFFTRSALEAVLSPITTPLNGGKLLIYSGTEPASASGALESGSLLAELVFGNPAFNASSLSGNTLSYQAALIQADESANATGVASFFRAVKPDNTVVFQGTIGIANSGADLILSDLQINAGYRIEVTQLTLEIDLNSEVFAAAAASAEPNNWLSGTSADETLNGTTGNDRVFDSGGVDLMTGGIGDDTYDVGIGDVMVEYAGGGTDTAIIYGDFAYFIPKYVENVTMSGTGNATMVGNDQNNVITGNTGADTIDGGRGNDTLTGGSGADIFAFGPDSGSDRIVDFTPGTDKVRIMDASMTAAQALALMEDTADGARLPLAYGAALLFSGKTKSQFTTADFVIHNPASMDLTGYSLTWSQEFNDPAAPLFVSEGGPFQPLLSHWENLRRFAGNNEQQTYTDPSFGAAPYNPFTVHDGMLTIRAIPTPVGLSGDVTTPYVSGCLETSGGPASTGPHPEGFKQHYGYWEMRAKLPAGQGMWPAFWLVGAGEIDILEGIGAFPNVAVHSTHYFSEPQIHTSKHIPLGFDTTQGFHTYGLQWTYNSLKWYIDGKMTHELDGTTYRTFGPSFLIVNLALGGNWGGNVQAWTNFPAEMHIDYIRVYQNAALAAP